MLPPHLKQFENLPVEQVYAQALRASAQARQMLADCYELFGNVKARAPGLDMYQRGALLATIWDIEHVFGHKGTYLSAAGQDEFVHQAYFKDKKDGVFLEIGGYNGWRGSNCYFFEKTLGWKGAIVEASPTLAQEIARHRSSEIVQAAITDKEGTAEFLDVIFGKTQMGGLANLYKDKQLQEVRAYPGHREQMVRVPTMTLAALLDKLSFRHVDYCSIDVEGAERAILSGFDFAKYDISVFSIENNAKEVGSLRDIMIPAGYNLVTVIGDDEIYVKNNL